MSEPRDVIWRDVWLGYGIGLLGTAILGGGIFAMLGPNMWWLAAASVLALLVAGFQLTRGTGRWEGLSATLVTIVYFVTTTVILIVGMMFEILPEPLPGLPKGDSTFFFVWPLAQLASTVVGAFLGQRWGIRRTAEVTGRWDEEFRDARL
ncbi:MAG: hypothetical protein ACE5I2_12130 [Anaerolineae bacterium]